jgi:hypothetical protein
MSSIQSGDVACTQRSDVRCLEHFLELFDVVDSAFDVHSVSISNKVEPIVKWRGIFALLRSSPEVICQWLSGDLGFSRVISRLAWHSVEGSNLARPSNSSFAP